MLLFPGCVLLRLPLTEFSYSHSISGAQVVQLTGVALLVVSRSMVARRKGTWRV